MDKTKRLFALLILSASAALVSFSCGDENPSDPTGGDNDGSSVVYNFDSGSSETVTVYATSGEPSYFRFVSGVDSNSVEVSSNDAWHIMTWDGKYRFSTASGTTAAAIGCGSNGGAASCALLTFDEVTSSSVSGVTGFIVDELLYYASDTSGSSSNWNAYLCDRVTNSVYAKSKTATNELGFVESGRGASANDYVFLVRDADGSNVIKIQCTDYSTPGGMSPAWRSYTFKFAPAE